MSNDLFVATSYFIKATIGTTNINICNFVRFYYMKSPNKNSSICYSLRYIATVALTFLVGYVDFVYADQPPIQQDSIRNLPLQGPQVSVAIGHYARARTYLIEALREFDKGKKISDPSPLLDTIDWRASVIEKAKDLEIILDPQGRETEGGVKYDAAPGLLSKGNN